MQIQTVASRCIVIVSLAFSIFCWLIEAFPQYALLFAFVGLPTGAGVSLLYIHFCRDRIIDHDQSIVSKKSDGPLNVIAAASVCLLFYSFGRALLALCSSFYV